MGFPPEKEAAKSTWLLIAMLLGGCIPFSTQYSTTETHRMESFSYLSESAACSEPNSTPPFVDITGTFSFHSSTPTSVSLYSTPNLSQETAAHVLRRCTPVGTIRVESGADFSLRGLTLGHYLLVADIPANASGPVMSFKVQRDKTEHTDVSWTRMMGDHFVIAMTIKEDEDSVP